MKKTILAAGLMAVTFISTSAFVIQSTGMPGYTGSPGEASCNSCHGGGTTTASGITITATPSFTNNEYMPGTTYTISVLANAAGFTRYGFGCEILNDNNTNAGTMQLNGSGTGVRLASFGAKTNAVHSITKTGNATATFTFKWIAPASTMGNVNIYVAANAVDGNGGIMNDFPIPPISLQLAEGFPPVNTGLAQQSKGVSQVSVYPNPASGLSNMSYYLNSAQLIQVELVDLNGRPVKQLVSERQEPGTYSQLLDLQNVTAGIYFIRITANGSQISQKLISVQ